MRPRAFALITGFGFAGTALIAEPPKPAGQADIYEMVAAIAVPTAGAKIGGSNQSFEKVVTIGRNAEGAPVVTSIQVIAPEKAPELPANTLAVMIVHHDGQCPAPYGNDGAGVPVDTLVFVVSPSGKNIWQVQPSGENRSMSLIKSASERGPLEEVQPTPDRYRTYPCEKYR